MHGATAASGANRLRWIGGYQTQLGNYLLGYRQYNSTYARFTQPDPTGQEFNAYAYAKGDPVNRTDTTGTVSAGCVNAGATAAFALLGAAATPSRWERPSPRSEPSVVRHSHAVTARLDHPDTRRKPANE
ncbi:RHS repeat-associated core domain-containing protein [Amycolatopsis pretoriensis]|uniref:RHS repeat-associated core domain-containing protein n=1 Tax=Amycolatopsis pretoriensis TaxID=218821 RepID=UPI000A38BBD0|nr:RHS repeat-associated core domain-containing protein [Amycolatopsis pretoriensis]